jgi:LysR family transcriptional regulator, glycine cleavage system transcriptional activator
MHTSRRLPSLTALRTFEAAARHLSFTRAAAELHVTQAAVSRLIRDLESHLGKQLFRRLPRQVELTSEGALLATTLSRSFSAIGRSLHEIQESSSPTLRISVEPTFASRWLLPRLMGFAAKHPDIRLQIDSSYALRHVGSDADLAIRYFDETLGDVPKSELVLAHVSSFPVLAPSLVCKGTELREPKDLLQHRLLHEDDERYWASWFVKAGQNPTVQRPGIYINEQGLVLDAAIRGVGIALGDELFAGDDLRAGRLIRPFETEIVCGCYCLLVEERKQQPPGVEQFQHWLLDELKSVAV